MRKFLSFLVTVALIGCAVYLAPRLLHNCDTCGGFFFGTGYRANVVTDMVAGEDLVICKDCAKKHHAISIGLGKSLDDFAIPLFEQES